MENYGLKEGVIITENEEGADEISGREVSIRPAWKWLLGF